MYDDDVYVLSSAQMIDTPPVLQEPLPGFTVGFNVREDAAASSRILITMKTES